MTPQLRALAAPPPLPVSWLVPVNGSGSVDLTVPVGRPTDPLWIADRSPMRGPAVGSPPASAARVAREWLGARAGSADVLGTRR